MKNKTNKRRISFSPIHYFMSMIVLLLSAQTAHADFISYTLTSLGGADYRYEYTVTNDGSLGVGVAIEGFTIMFDPALYDEDSLNIVTAAPLASDWDEIILGSGLLVDTAYDAYALAGGVATGSTVSGFAVKFTWLGSGTPGAQSYEIYDQATFDLIASGTTSLASSIDDPTPPQVPEPNIFILLLTAAFAAIVIGRRRKPAVISATVRHLL